MSRAVPLTLRPARADDAAALTAIAFAAKASHGYPAAVLERWRDELTIDARRLAQWPTTVAERGGAVAGFCALGHADDRWWIEHCWVHPAHAGCGVGRALVAHTMAAARARGASALWVDADPHAEGFYRALGAGRRHTVPAPIPGDPARARPVLSWPLG